MYLYVTSRHVLMQGRLYFLKKDTKRLFLTVTGSLAGLCSMFPCILSVPCDPSFILFSVLCILHCSLATSLDSFHVPLHPFWSL